MQIDDIRVVGGSLAFVTFTLDGMPCEARTEGGDPVIRRTAHPSPIVLRGSDVPEPIRAALSEAAALSRELSVLTAEEVAALPPRVSVVLPDPHFLCVEPPGA